ncbi:alkaline phosphatase isoform X4 [Procambarus clarkii]|uniref:alkaline phosphatase isoform X4 n=1 Tax=Procambarus clarkii TaxID=6728 RepID=UPI003741F3EF
MRRVSRGCGGEVLLLMMRKMMALVMMALLVMTLVCLPQAPVVARVEDRDYWYAQAKSHLEDIVAARRASQGYAKNVILFVGDGMGVSTVTAGRILKGQREGQSGEEYRLSFEKFPYVALAKTYNIDAQIGDSSACATALLCGVKANVNTLGLDHRGKFEDCMSSYTAGVTSIIDWAQKHGKSTGIVTNTRITHGTPSALYARSPSRYWEDDAKIPAHSHASCKDIARQLIENEPGKNINVLMGGGRRHLIPTTVYDREERNQRGRRTDGRNLLDEWVHDKKTRDLNAEYVWNKAQFDKVDPRHTDYLLGVFGYSHLDFEVDRNKGPTGDPSLAEMTVKAIQILRKNPHGFFLMVEGFDTEISDLDGKPYTTLLYGNGPGYAHTTPTGRQDLTGFNTQDINFVQQAAVPRKYETHGGEDVPVYAMGPGAHLFSGTVEQTYIAHAIAHAACIAEDNSHCEKPPSDDACAAAPGPVPVPTARRPLGQVTPTVDDQKLHTRDPWAWNAGTRAWAWTNYHVLSLLMLPVVLVLR